jgi:hypothetical protein
MRFVKEASNSGDCWGSREEEKKKPIKNIPFIEEHHPE